MCSRLRAAGYKAGGIHLSIIYKDGSRWHKGRRLNQPRFDSQDFYRAAFRLLIEALPAGRQVIPVLNLAISCFGLSQNDSTQLEFFNNVPGKVNLVQAVDKVNERWGDFTVGSARSLNGAKVVMDRISFACPQSLSPQTA